MSKHIIKTKMKKILISLTLTAFLPLCAAAQPMTYGRFIKAVSEKNAAYLAEKYSIDIATAELQAAKVFNDPELSVSYGNNQDWSIQMGQSLETELSYDLDLAGVRKARIAAASVDKDMTEASVAAYLSSLRLEAARAWADAWSLRENCLMMEEAVRDMMQIAAGDSLRLNVGDVSKADAMQSRVEARTLLSELTALRAEYSNALTVLSELCGGEKISGIEDRELPMAGLPYSIDTVCDMAEQMRSDLKAAELSRTLSERNIKLVKATRGFEMGVTAGYSYNTEVRNEIAPAPIYHGLSVGLTIPLKFSSANRGELRAAETRLHQSEKYYEAARLQVRAEAARAYNSLQAASAVLEQYDGSLLKDAEEIAESRRQGYLKGESTMLELIAAQQTMREVMRAYIEARRDLYICQVSLQHAIGASW